MLKPCRVLVALALAALSGCAHSVHQVYISSMDKDAAFNQGKWQTVETADFVVLGFQFNTDYVEKAYQQLEQQCKGRIAQVTSEHLTSYKFLSYEQKLVLKGLCLSRA
jgi:hypothetical protein